MPAWKPLIVRALRLVAALALIGVVAIGAGRLVRRMMATRIARIAAGSDDQQGAAYSTLLAMNDSALGALVKNASLADPQAARPARDALLARLDTWAAASIPGDAGRLASRAQRLTRLLASETPDLTRSGITWAEHLAHRVLSLVSQLDEADRAETISEVDRLLGLIARSQPRPDSKPLASVAQHPVAPSSKRPTPTAPNTPPPPPQPLPMARTLPRSMEAQPIAPPSGIPSRETPRWQPDWQAETGNDASPARPIDQPRISTTPPATLSKIPKGIHALEDRVLLAMLLENADTLLAYQKPQAYGPGTPAPLPMDAQLLAVRKELASRGYSAVRVDLVEKLMSPQVPDRLRLVEELLAGRSGDVSRMLLLLAKDPSPEVRIAALTALGSSSQQVLIDAAWALSIRDKDPRVAKLADSLRKRAR